MAQDETGSDPIQRQAARVLVGAKFVCSGFAKQGEFDLDVARAATGVKYIAMNSINRPDKSKPQSPPAIHVP